MNTHLSVSLRRSRSGVALVIVLSMLVLLSALVVAFLTTATNERAATSANAGVTRARQIADSTTSLVISQIRDATTQLGTNGGKPDENVTWASQPGAITTFSGALTGSTANLRDGATYDTYIPGTKDFVYKLYSADKMKVQESDYEKDAVDGLPGETSIIKNWDIKNPTTDYVDLNEPILTPRRDLASDGHRVEPRYPIIDPRAAYTATETAPLGGAVGIVDGFDAKITPDKTLQLAASTAQVPYVPMPVKWLYILEDGTIGPASLATAKNPIVGRTAFWTDDESCKLNINTASEGTFWDTPTASDEAESGRINGSVSSDALTTPSSQVTLSLAVSQPIHDEFQRYPGHPATTCLSPVLGWLWNLTPSTPVWPMKDPKYTAFKDAMLRIAPFTAAGKPTTMGATINSNIYVFDGTGNKTYIDPSTAIIEDVATKHLYTSVDEMLFKSERYKNPGNGDPLLNTTLTTSTTITPEAIEKMRFFLTANSRAPELNLFGRPRVTIWPIAADPTVRTQFDDLFLFTSTLSKGTNGANPVGYNLYRYDAKNDTNDFTLKDFPALNGQNQKMFSYLQDMTSRDIPGFGGNFKSKLGDDRDQILTLIFDYIRSVNLVDTGTASLSGNLFAPYTPRFYPKGSASTYNDSQRVRSVDWSGQVTPLKIGSNSGIGRFIAIKEAGLLFYRTTIPAQGANPAKPAMQAVLILEMASPAAGFPAIRETFFTQGGVPVPQTGDVTANQLFIKFSASPAGTPLTPANFPVYNKIDGPGADSWINVNNVASHEVTDGRGFMPSLGYNSTLQWYPAHRGPTDPTNVKWSDKPNNDPNRNAITTITGKSVMLADNITAANKSTANRVGTYNPSTSVQFYPYVSDKIPLPVANGQPTGTFSFLGGPTATDPTHVAMAFDLEIWTGESYDPLTPSTAGGRGVKVQTVHLSFPPCTAALPMPGIVADDFKTRFNGTFDGVPDTIRGGDVVRTIELSGAAPYNADIRMIAALRDVPPLAYVPANIGTTANGYNSAQAIVDDMHIGHGNRATGNPGGGLLVAGQAVNDAKRPMLPFNVVGVKKFDGTQGDFDRGLSKHMDGAMIGKVDEGNLQFQYNEQGDPGAPSYRLPYFHGRNIEETGQSFFTPNRQMASAVMFGSLPRGIKNGHPWETLLFRPSRENAHPGAAKPPDHLLLDLFSLPVVEPYAISEPFSTAGKVNLNYVLAPFGYAEGTTGSSNPGTQGQKRSYIRRDTALRGVLRSVFMMAVPNTTTDGGHTEQCLNAPTSEVLRWPINLNKTLEAMETRMKDTANGRQLFRSASEICNVDLYPEPQGSSTPAPLPTPSWATFWNNNALTGDNMRERPYAHIYPRVTTKSNIYTVHMRCEAIRKSPHSDVNGFDPKLDQVVGTYRGSATIERFIDPNDPDLAAYNMNSGGDRVDPYYRYRVINTKLFAPK